MQQNVYNDLYNNVANTAAVRITKLIFIPTKEYNDVFRRPYEMNANANTLRILENVVGQQLERGGNVNAVALAQNTPDIMKMSSTSGERIEIAHGWQQVRLRFLLEVESDLNDSTYISYIQGYTDYHDPSLSGNIDPKMPMHINSITNVIRSFTTDGQIMTRVNSSFNVLYNPYSRSYDIEDTTHSSRLLRPKDIADGIDKNHMYQTGVNTIDTRSAYGFLPQESKRLNNIGVQHVAEVINSFALGKEMASIGFDQGDMFNVAASSLSENNLSSVPFIEALSLNSGITGTVDFDLNALSMIKPDLETVLMLVDNSTPMMQNSLQNSILDTNVTERLDGASYETTIANSISEAVSGLLVDEMLSTIDFSITNMTPNSELVVAISDVKSFIHGIDVTVYADRFINKFKALVMPGVTQQGLVGVDIFIHADVLGETTVAVGLNGNPPVVYRLPTFCNSLYTSVVGDDGQYNVMVEEFDQILQMANINSI